MRYPKFYLLCVFFLLIAACSFPHRPTEGDLLMVKTSVANKEVFDMGGQAFVIIGTQNDLTISKNVKFYSEFNIIDERGNVVSNTRRFIMDGNYMFLLNPGKYRLDKYRLVAVESSSSSIKTSTLPLYERYSFSFETKAGEVVYLGDIVTMTQRVEREDAKWYQTKYTGQVINNTVIKDSSANSKDLFERIEGYTNKKVQTRFINFRDNALPSK